MKGIWTYADLLPTVAVSDQVTLGESSTPLVRSRRIGPDLGLSNLFFKLENLNPSGSYKDRFAAMAVSDLKHKGARLCMATSSGNTGAALAAYCAAADITCLLAIVDGAPLGKLQQMQVYGAKTMMVRNFGKDPVVTAEVMEVLQMLAKEQGVGVQISAYCYSPVGMAGVQTIAYELADALPDVHAQVFVPAGGGGLALAIANGFNRLNVSAIVNCVQPVGNDTIASPLRAGRHQAVQITSSTTTISGLQVPNVLDGNAVIGACHASGGSGFSVTDDLIYTCQHELARKEGIFCEPAGAVALAGIKQAARKGELDRQEPVVCLITGHGFKEPVSAANMAKKAVNLYLNGAGELKEYIETSVNK